jgi:shikimate kinase
MGSGKTTVGRRVAELAGADFVDLDQEIEAAAGRTVAEIFAAGGEPHFRSLEREAARSAIAPGRVVALGGGAPMQEQIWRQVRADTVSVFLDAPLDVIRPRLGEAEGRPLARGDLEALLAERIERYREADHRVDAARPVAVVAEEVMSLWSG